MNNTVRRVIMFCVAMPLLILIVVVLPHYGHLLATLFLCAAGFVGGWELKSMLARKKWPLPKWSPVLPMLTPLLAWAINMGFIGRSVPVHLFVLAVLWALSGAIFGKEDEIKESLSKVGGRLLLVVYPVFLLWWVARLFWLEQASLLLLLFMLTVFLSDGAAWLFGSLLGRHRGIFAVSPRKSLEGLIGGFAASVIVMWVFSIAVPSLFFRPLWQILIFGLICGAAVCLGDLAESTLKRACGVKDSGTIIPGRGGVLDSMDSVFFCAPLFIFFFDKAVI